MTKSDIDIFIKNLKNNKRKFNDIEEDYIINDLKWIAYDCILDFINKNNITTSRQISVALNSLEEIFKNSSKIFSDMTKDEDIRLTLKAFSHILNEVIEDIRIKIYSEKNINVIKYIHKMKSLVNKKRSRLVNDIGITLDIIDDNNISDEDTDIETTEEDTEDDNKYDDKGQLIKDFHNEIKDASNSNNNIDDIMEYFSSLDNNYKVSLINKFKTINNFMDNKEPSLIKVLNMNTTDKTKKTLITKINKLNSGFGDKAKLQSWVENAMKIPFGITKGIDMMKLKKKKNRVNKFLKRLSYDMDSAIYGHKKAKEQVSMMMAQMIRNPKCKGNVFGLWGPPGNGKTALIKEGIAKAMRKPFAFISLGGATDASYLDGHSYTYEGSIYGRIVQAIIDSKCMDPIIYFDELDKVSRTHKGDEIINLLIHMIDPSQNSHFKDKYFYDLDIDLSKVTFIFSFNNPDYVNYILLDRITCIETKYLTLDEKMIIGNDYLLKDILIDVGLNKEDVIINNDIFKFIILKYTYEGGVRKLKQLIYEIIRKLNKLNLTKSNKLKKEISFPYTLQLSDLDHLLKDYRRINRDKIHKTPNIGMVNGLWASDMGIGGVLPIESSFIPAKDFMNVKTTGSLKNVMKESIQVAYSVAWNYVNDEIKNKYLEKWEKSPETFHIHCPDGAVPKDGPSAGAAMTLVMYSHLCNLKINNKVAMTGEINLRGNVTAIGGLEEKLVGAKLAGVEHALIPKENEEDFQKVIMRQPKLIDSNFKVTMVDHFSEIPGLVKSN